jgi:hypothetical protein
MLFFLVTLFTLVLGIILTGVSSILSNNIGAGNIEIIFDKIGRITGANGQLIVFLAGIFLVTQSLGYAFKSFSQFAQIKSYEKNLENLKGFVQYFNPRI